MPTIAEIFGNVSEKIASLYKGLNLIEERQKRQDDEIVLLRKDNSELRKDNAAMAERLARLEEGRKTLEEARKGDLAEVKAKMTELMAAYEMKKMQEELDALKRKQISGD